MRRRSPSFTFPRWFSTFLAASSLSGALACSTRHLAPIETSELPPPPGEKVLHTDRIVVHITEEAARAQCVAYERFHPVCFQNIRAALEHGLARSLWPSFPEVVIGTPADARPSDYLLQVEITLDALPPDDAGPGWSAGARSRFRVLREGKVIAEETLASRSRAHFPYGSPLGEGATEVVDATVLHVATKVSQIPESRPDEPKPLPRVAANTVEVNKPSPLETTETARGPEAAPERAKSPETPDSSAEQAASSGESPALGESSSPTPPEPIP
jgi:hypothetical protein